MLHSLSSITIPVLLFVYTLLKLVIDQNLRLQKFNFSTQSNYKKKKKIVKNCMTSLKEIRDFGCNPSLGTACAWEETICFTLFHLDK